MRDATITLALTAVCLLAGCASAPGATTVESPTDTTAVEPPTDATTIESTTNMGDSRTSTTGDTTTTGADAGGDSDERDSTDDDSADESTGAGEGGLESVNASALATDASMSLARADGVVVAGNLTREVRAPSGSRTVAIEFVERVDVAGRAVGVERTVTANGRSVETATYLVNGTVFERSPAYERQYGTAWIELDASDGAWANTSSTAVVSRLVNASAASVRANATVDGERAVVLALDVDLAELEALSGFVVDEDAVNALDGTITVDPETGRVLAATLHVNRTAENSYGQEVTVVTTVTRTFRSYGPVTVTLPEGADDATPINATAT